MSWNYRVVDFGNYVKLCEVYYDDDDGSIRGYISGPFGTFEDKGDLEETLNMMLEDCKYRPVLKVEELT